jgi:transposase
LGRGGEERAVLRGGKVKLLYELKGQGMSIRGISRKLEISRNTARKYLRASELPKAKPRPKRGSKLDPHKEYINQRVGEGVINCVVLLRELRERGYDGGISILKRYVHPLRTASQPTATMRFETKPGKQAQVDFGRVSYLSREGVKKHLWLFVMVLGWSRMLYVEFLTRADLPSFIRCHINAFRALRGVPETCLYDNCKAVISGRDKAGEPVFNSQFLDFALRLGFAITVCQPYRAKTKGKVESGIKYVKGNFWPSAKFVDLDDLNQQAKVWYDTVANVRVHGTTCERPVERWMEERNHLGPLVGQEKLRPFLRERRKVGRDGYVRFEGASYGVPWEWAGQAVEVQAGETGLEIWAGNERLAVHPKAMRVGQRFTLPGQWSGLGRGNARKPTEVLGLQLPTVEVQRRCLEVYDELVAMGVAR